MQDEALRRAIQDHAEALRQLQENKASREEVFAAIQDASSRPTTAAPPPPPPAHLSDAALREQQKRVDALQANLLAELGMIQ